MSSFFFSFYKLYLSKGLILNQCSYTSEASHKILFIASSTHLSDLPPPHITCAACPPVIVAVCHCTRFACCSMWQCAARRPHAADATAAALCCVFSNPVGPRRLLRFVASQTHGFEGPRYSSCCSFTVCCIQCLWRSRSRWTKLRKRSAPWLMGAAASNAARPPIRFASTNCARDGPMAASGCEISTSSQEQA